MSPHQPSVVTVGAFQSGTASNIIPDTAVLEVSMRAVDPEVRVKLRDRVEQIVTMQAESYGANATFDWLVGYPATINDAAATKLAQDVITQTFGPDAHRPLEQPLMGSEDFSFMLEKVAGAYVLVGNGDTAPLHTTAYDFNDDILERGATYFHRLARSLLA